VIIQPFVLLVLQVSILKPITHALHVILTAQSVKLHQIIVLLVVMFQGVNLQPVNVLMATMIMKQLEVVCNVNIIALVKRLNFVKHVFTQIFF